jgi:hypothetical protein
MVFPVWGLTLNVKVCSAEPGKCCNSHREFVMYQDEFLQNAALLNTKNVMWL